MRDASREVATGRDARARSRHNSMASFHVFFMRGRDSCAASWPNPRDGVRDGAAECFMTPRRDASRTPGALKSRSRPVDIAFIHAVRGHGTPGLRGSGSCMANKAIPARGGGQKRAKPGNEVDTAPARRTLVLNTASRSERKGRVARDVRRAKISRANYSTPLVFGGERPQVVALGKIFAVFFFRGLECAPVHCAPG